MRYNFSSLIQPFRKQISCLSLVMSAAFFACAPKAEHFEPVDLVYPLLDTENSRWFYFSSACRPFGMVNLSPDTQIGGAWGSGYRFKTDTVKGISHVHAWQLAGVSVMPVTIEPETKSSIYHDFYSRFSHASEKVAPGYHALGLERYGIEVELTSTKRVGLHRYQFPENVQAAILLSLNGLLGPSELTDGRLEQNSSSILTGSVVNQPTKRRPKPTTVFFHIELNTEIQSLEQDSSSGDYLIVLDKPQNAVLMKVGISYTSSGNARQNLQAELPHWDFDQVVQDSRQEWNALLSRIKIEGGSHEQQKRFYTDLWHALQGRRLISDVTGTYPDNTGDTFRIGQLPTDATGKPKFNHYNSDSFWGAQWTLNTLWGLVYPDIYEDFLHSLMQYYRDGGLIPRGPSGGNYTFVMTGASSTPFIVSAIQRGIVKDHLEEIYAALKKNHMPGGIMAKAGYEHGTLLGGGLTYYIDQGYVPYPVPEGDFGYHQDGASLTMEYAYQDWTLAQLAKKLGHEADYEMFRQRAKNFQNVFDADTGWMRPKDVNGNWRKNFDPYEYENGFNESNSAQSTWFVPHDIRGLAALMGGEANAVEKLNAQFEAAEQLGFTAGTSHDLEIHPEYRRIPINYGNQPSIQTAFIFNQLGRPDLTQYWSRKIVDRVFSGLSPSTGYNGDEDQGLMGALAVLMKIGLFQMSGGTEENPVYELGSPLFDKMTIELHPEYYPGKQFVITKSKSQSDGAYIKTAVVNQKVIDGFQLRHEDIINGGELKLEMAGRPKQSSGE
ncbi:GH92 family glycosyl hydrolase [candidate division KSB1 bacterium]|nr:GH92 family glycosyl hydrolase [candidate division KSB1 bacterium]